MTTGRPESKRAARERLAADRAREAQDRQRRERRIRILAAVAVVVLVVGLGVFWQVNRTKVDPAAPRPAGVAEVGAGVTVGTAAAGAPVIDLYEDFQCPACRDFEQTVGPTLRDLAETGKAKLVYHPLSFLGEESVRAANAFGCAADAGKAGPFHDALFANQPPERSGGYKDPELTRAGEQVGITGERFAACVTGGTYSGWVRQVARAGSDKGVTGTPTVFVDGKELPRDGYTADGVKAAVAAAQK
jgi:protein-disulfide isomerase